jgi:hypothetical protein
MDRRVKPGDDGGKYGQSEPGRVKPSYDGGA